MIPLTDASWQGRPWQWLLANAVSDTSELVSLLGLPLQAVASPFPVRVPLPYLARIERGNPADPLLLQVLPRPEEGQPTPGYVNDPLEEAGQSPAPGMLHKYHGRVLVVVSGACAINCRYCFRRHFPYQDFQPDTADWNAIVDYIANNPDVGEVILSGGDPLVLSDKRLAGIAARLADIAHVHTLRIHTRVPVTVPQRVCPALLDWVEATRLKVVMVMHSNHARELDADVGDAMFALQRAGVTLLNQSVLLAGVNDSAGALVALSQRLFDIGVMPYYLHMLDAVAGAAHFDVDESRARRLVKQAKARLPGYLVPRLVREIPGEPYKVGLSVS